MMCFHKVKFIKVSSFVREKDSKTIIYLFLYLAALGLSCCMWDLISWRGMEPKPLHWEWKVLATGLPRKFPYIFLYEVPAVTGKRHVKDKIYYLLWRSCVCLCAESLQSCQTLFDPMDCSPPDSSVPGILQARILERVAMPFSRISSWPRDQIWVSCTEGRFFTIWTTKEALILILLPYCYY